METKVLSVPYGKVVYGRVVGRDIVYFMVHPHTSGVKNLLGRAMKAIFRAEGISVEGHNQVVLTFYQVDILDGEIRVYHLAVANLWGEIGCYDKYQLEEGDIPKEVIEAFKRLT